MLINSKNEMVQMEWNTEMKQMKQTSQMKQMNRLMICVNDTTWINEHMKRVNESIIETMDQWREKHDTLQLWAVRKMEY